MSQNIDEVVERLNFQHEAIVELVKVMDKYNLSFSAQPFQVAGDGKYTDYIRFCVRGDFAEDGEPLVLCKIDKETREATYAVADIARPEWAEK